MGEPIPEEDLAILESLRHDFITSCTINGTMFLIIAVIGTQVVILGKLKVFAWIMGSFQIANLS
jgi:hypothetical protein